MSPESSRDRLRLRLLIGSLLVIALVSALSLALRESVLRREQIGQAIAHRGSLAELEYESFFQPIRSQLAMIRDWGREGKLDPSNPDNLALLLIPVLDHQDWAGEFILYPDKGDGYRLVNGPSGWKGGTVDRPPAAWHPEALAGSPDEVHWIAADYPAGLWAGVSWPNASGTRDTAGIRIATARVEDTVARSPVGSGGLIALVGPDHRLFWHMPGHGSRFRPAEAEDLLDPDLVPERLIAEAFIARLHGHAPPGEAFHFHDHGESWWGWWGKVLTVDRERELLLLAPASDVIHGSTLATDPVSWLLLGLFLGCLGLLARRILRDRRRLEEITRATLDTRIPEAELRTLIRAGENERVECKASLRWSVRHGEIRHQVELSWLKTVVAFLNTRGGTILLGVADDGTITGLDADGFANDDRCLLYLNDLLQRHVGVEFRPFLRGAIRRIDGIAILVLQVLPADRPAFLIEQSDEQFYIRMGPATRRLNLRQTFAYLEEFAKR